MYEEGRGQSICGIAKDLVPALPQAHCLESRAQLVVHQNRGQQREAIPYGVVIMSSLYDGYHRCIEVPWRAVIILILRSNLPLNPVFNGY